MVALHSDSVVKGKELITLEYQGGFGNKLWQYAVGRLLAENLGLLFVSKGIPGLQNCPKYIPGKIKMTERIELQGHYLPDSLAPRRIHLNGYFERYENISPYIEKISKWYQPKMKNMEIDLSALTVSIRRGSNNWPVATHCPDKEYYLEKIGQLGFSKHYLCTDSPDDPFIQEIVKEIPSCTLIRSGVLSQFNFLQNSTNIFLAPSTFSWWAAMTGKAEQIFWPQISALDFTNTNHDWFPKGNNKLVLV